MDIETLTPAQAQLQMPHAAAFAHWLLEHLQQEGVQLMPAATADRQRLVMDSVGALEIAALSEQELECEVWPVDAPMLALIKMSLLEHAQEFLSQRGLDPLQLTIHWSDAEDEDTQSRPGLERLQVLSYTDVTPRMRRFRLKTSNLQTLVHNGLHIRLLLPTPGQPVNWPRMDGDGRLQYPDAAQRLPQRVYTIVQSNAAEGWLEIDMLQHGMATTTTCAHTAPGAFWAEHAQPGDMLGAITPAGGRLQTACAMVLVADNCALPALARQLQALPPSARVQVVAMVEDEHEIRPLPLPKAHQIRWLIAPSSEDLLQAVQSLDWSQPERMWAACGDAQAKALRRWVREHHSTLRSQISSYWR